MTTSNSTNRIPLHSLYLLDVVNILNSQINVNFTYSLPCGVTKAWSSVSSSPFNPPQEFLFPSNISFSEIQWNLPNKSEDVDSRVVYTYLLLDDKYNGTAEEIMETFGFSIGPGLVNEEGQRLTRGGMIYPTVKTNIACDSKEIEELLFDVNETLSKIV